MKNLAWVLLIVAATGCATRKSGVSKVDEFDDVKVDQMANNNVNLAVFQKTVVCLNGRREARKVLATTNVVVQTATNLSVVVVTNLSISMSTNHLTTAQTNLAPIQPMVVGGGNSPAEPAAPATADAAPATPTNSGPSITTNSTVSVSKTQGGTASPNQAAANSQTVRTLNNQITTVSNNLSISVMTNVVVTMETNQILNYVTNATVISTTNVVITPTNALAFDYYLYTELLTPSDFTLAQGESLILLLDGRRHGLSPGQSNTSFVSRRGYNSTLYRAAPEVLVAIANAREARVRIKGTSSVIERDMSDTSKQHFRDFLVKYFVSTPETKKSPPPTSEALLPEQESGVTAVGAKEPARHSTSMASANSTLPSR